MLVFPQLATGAVGQYPIVKRRRARTVVNEAADGVQVKLADAAAAAVEWDLEFSALSDAERAALESLHAAVEGRLGTFTFLDPTDNLLCWSEKLDETVWARNTLLTVEEMSGFWRITNTGAGALAISQTINAPGWFTYAFGMQARSSVGATVLLARTAGVDMQSLSFALGAEWRGIALSGSFGGAEEAVTFGIEVAPGESVDLREIQAEAQAGMSGYKKTFLPCGVYSQARFRDEALEFTAEAPDQHSCLARIRARG
jgi:hypothetical protein